MSNILSKLAQPFKLRNIPNTLTILRVILIPFFILFFYLPSSWSNLVAAFVFVVAAITDLFDGYLARKLKVCSKFGEFLDPVADKIMVCVALVLLVGHFAKYEANYFPYISVVVGLCSCVIVSREIVISALREWMAEVGSRAKVAVSWIGKWKTTIQMISIAGLIWRDETFVFQTDNWMVYASLPLMVIATILTIWSMVDYLIVGFSTMSKYDEARDNANASQNAQSAISNDLKQKEDDSSKENNASDKNKSDD